MAEYKITSEQINELYSWGYAGKGKTANALLKDWYPEEFKPKQEYCCEVFESAVKEGDVKELKLPEDIGRNPEWIVNHRWYQKYCFKCGEPVIPPIKS